MKLLSIKTTLLFFSQNRLVQEPDGPSLQDCGDLMSWHLSVWLKQNPLAFDTFNRIEFCAVRPDIGDKVVVLDRTAYVSIAIHDPNQVEQATTDLEVFDILRQVVRAGATQFDRHFGTGLSGFDRALSDLRDNQYVAKNVLTSRNPKGKKLSLSIEAEMTSTVLNVYFVERQGEQELRRELIQNSLPSAI